MPPDDDAPPMRPRAEHLVFAGERALVYLAHGNVRDAISSMLSDLEVHPETRAAGRAMTPYGLACIVDGDLAQAHRYIGSFQ